MTLMINSPENFKHTLCFFTPAIGEKKCKVEEPFLEFQTVTWSTYFSGKVEHNLNLACRLTQWWIQVLCLGRAKLALQRYGEGV